MRTRLGLLAAILVVGALALFVPPMTSRAATFGADGSPAFNGGTITGDITLNSSSPTITSGTNKNLNLTANGSGQLNLTGGSGTIVIRSPVSSGTSSTTNAGTGSCSSVTVSGTTLDFVITATCTAAQTVVVNFSQGFGGMAHCIIGAANSAAGATTGTAYQSAGASTTATFTFPAVTAGTYNALCFL